MLLDLLDTGIASLRGLTPAEAQTQAKYSELVMKCLWKLTKALQDTLRGQEINVAPLLLDLHKFLTTNPPTEWKRRASEQLPLGDMPLRTAKTIMHELATGLGSKVLDIMMASSIDEPKRSVVYSYLSHMLDASGQLFASTMTSAETTPAKVEGNLHSERSESSGSVGIAAHQPLTEEEVQMAIDQIFTKISSKDDTKQVR